MTTDGWAMILTVTVVAAFAIVVGYVFFQNWRRFKRGPRVESRRTRRPETYALQLAHGIFVTMDGNETWKAMIHGWHAQAWRWQEGDYLEVYRAGERLTRYVIRSIHRDAPAKWFYAQCEFAPRSKEHILAELGLSGIRKP